MKAVKKAPAPKRIRWEKAECPECAGTQRSPDAPPSLRGLRCGTCNARGFVYVPAEYIAAPSATRFNQASVLEDLR